MGHGAACQAQPEGYAFLMRGAPLTHERLALRLPVRPESVTVGRRAAAEFAEAAGFGASRLTDVRLAVSEALTNVVLHAHPEGSGEGHHVVLAAEADHDAVRVTVTDAGTGLRTRTDSPGMGLGLALIAESCDELGLDAARGGGTVVAMTFLR